MKQSRRESKYRAALRALLTCRGIDDTDQKSGITYREIVTKSLKRQ